MKRQCLRGFSLIELMVTIAIIGLLLVSTIPFTMSWVQVSHISHAENRLHEAIGRAKSIAIRNRFATDSDNAAAVVCLAGDTISVHEGAVAGPASCAANKVWQATLDQSVEIVSQQDTKTFQCMCIDNSGMPSNTLTGCAVADSCVASEIFNIKAGGSGGVNEIVSIF